MLAVAAMATQNVLVKLAMVKTPSTAVMTTNTTQLLIDMVTLARKGGASGEIDETRRRARVTFTCIVGFMGGCVAGAALAIRWVS
ncbi:MAG TPA: DUF1275 family protein [Bryobacteraceae bacterium]|nr:DUF1275 family protein [Bryobacteraceae bacterium]